VAQFYKLGEPEMRHVSHFRTTYMTYPLHFRNIEKANINLFELLPAIFDHAVDKILEGALESDYVGAELYHPHIYSSVNLSFQRRDKFRGSQLLDKL